MLIYRQAAGAVAKNLPEAVNSGPLKRTVAQWSAVAKLITRSSCWMPYSPCARAPSVLVQPFRLSKKLRLSPHRRQRLWRLCRSQGCPREEVALLGFRSRHSAQPGPVLVCLAADASSGRRDRLRSGRIAGLRRERRLCQLLYRPERAGGPPPACRASTGCLVPLA